MKERERNINVWLPLTCPLLGGLAQNPGLCPNWELNLQPFSLQASAQSIEPYQPGIPYLLIRNININQYSLSFNKLLFNLGFAKI